MDTREAITQALDWGWLKKSSMGWIDWHKYLTKIERSRMTGGWDEENLFMAKVLSEIHSQKPLVRFWLELCYGPDTEEWKPKKDLYRSTLAGHVMVNFTNSSLEKDKIMEVAKIAADDMTHRCRTERPFPRQVYANVIGLRYTNDHVYGWKPWGKIVDKCLDVYYAFDDAGISNIRDAMRAY